MFFNKRLNMYMLKMILKNTLILNIIYYIYSLLFRKLILISFRLLQKNKISWNDSFHRNDTP